MVDGDILSIIHTIAIDTILNFNRNNNEHGLKMLCVNRPQEFTPKAALFACGVFFWVLTPAPGI